MPKLDQAFKFTPNEAAHILERHVLLRNSSTHELIKFVIECGSKADIIRMISRCGGDQLRWAMIEIEDRLSAKDRIKCLQRLPEVAYTLRVRDRILTALLKQPIERWFGEEARITWKCHDCLTAPEIDLMVQRVLEKGDSLWAVCMSRFEVDRCGTHKPFLTEAQRKRLAPLAAKDKSAT